MGTEVESKMYLPGYYSMKDLSGSTGYGGWSLPHDSSSLKNGQHYGMYVTARIPDEADYDDYEKDKLRQTIMKHESIFRHQVHELHRLYRIQRDLMSEVRIREQVSYSIPIGASQPSLFSSSFRSEEDKQSWRSKNFPFVGSNYGIPSSLSAGVIASPQSSVKVASVGSGLKETEDLKCKKPQRRLFDLEAPADEYTDGESEAERDSMVSRTANPRIKEASQARHISDEGDALRSNSCSKRSHNLADLNEPLEDEEASASASDNDLGSDIYSQARSTNTQSNMWFSAKQVSKNPNFYTDRGINNVHIKNDSRYGVQAGNVEGKSYFTGSFHVEDLQKASSSSRVEAVGRANGFAVSRPCDQQNTSGKQVKRKIFGVEVAEGNNEASSLASKPINASNPESFSISSWTRTQSSFNPSMIQHGPNKYQSESNKVETPQATFPWLARAKDVSLKEETVELFGSRIDCVQNGSGPFWNQTDTRKGPSQSIIRDSSSATRGHDTESRRAERSECSSVKRILGFPIFDLTSKPDPVVDDSPLKITSGKFIPACCHVSSITVEKSKVEDPKKGLVNDRSYLIDLNECVVQDEDHLIPTSLIPKRTTGIDLEAPVIIETDSDEEPLVNKPEKHSDENLDQLAAEALVAIASQHLRNPVDSAVVDLREDVIEASPTSILYMLADIVSSHCSDSPNGELACDDDDDDFEFIILTLPEEKLDEQSYLPPSSDVPREEEDEAATPRRPRRAQARRGRQRVKDFQKDVLPGIVSLSRNEVTEDLQTLEGMVRAVGGTWQSSLLPRSGGGRGRKRSVVVVPPPAEETGVPKAVEEVPQGRESKESSLTGWGKRTRRPPRHRCPVSNSVT